MKPLILIGMPGAGKSHWARQVSAASGRAALDLDAVLAAKAGKSIPEIFAAEGEAGFRKRESETLKEILASGNDFILATGGGTPCFGHNLARLKAAGTVVYLEAPADLLAARILAQPDARPLLAGLPEKALLERLQKLLAEREPFYRQAQVIAPVATVSAATFAAL